MQQSPMPQSDDVFTTDVPARLDRLPWSRFHWLVVTALGITWILDGLEVTLIGALGGAITDSPALRIDSAGFGFTASAYLAGAVVGALFFGWLTDKLGRKKLFTVTVLLYVLSTIASGLAWDFPSLMLFRFLTGAGIGGEYAAINATIQELIPARRRGFTDLCINGSFWLGAMLGAVGATVVLDPRLFAPDHGWRAAFVIGGAIGLVVLLLRQWLPESPRWLMTHGQPEEAARIVGEIEARVMRETGCPLPSVTDPPLRLRRHAGEWFLPSLRVLATQYRRQASVAFVLMGAQAFLYNAIFFTYALVLRQFYGVPSEAVGWYILPFAAGNLAGPIVLGRLFDTLGRRLMIGATYALSGVLLAAAGWAFAAGWLSAWGQTAAWTAIFFFASAAASSAYLTVGETFPLEVRAIAIAAFYAAGTAIGGVAGPAIFGALIQTGSRTELLYGYLAGAALMLIAAGTVWRFGTDAERKPLEQVAPPLSAA